LDQRAGENGSSDKGEKRGWVRLSPNCYIQLFNHQSLIEAKWERKNLELGCFDNLGRQVKPELSKAKVPSTV
jgi:hypothetical protein